MSIRKTKHIIIGEMDDGCALCRAYKEGRQLGVEEFKKLAQEAKVPAFILDLSTSGTEADRSDKSVPSPSKN